MKMVGWKSIFQRSRSRGALDQHESSNLDDFDVATHGDEKPVAGLLDNKENTSKTDSTFTTLVAEEDSLPEDIRDYYYPDMDKDDANDALQDRPVGTFLLRQSKSPDARYTLSVRSVRAVFNIRIYYRYQSPEKCACGYHLDSPVDLRKYFPSISALLRYYSLAPRELIALCVVEDGDERSIFKLQYPLSRSENNALINVPVIAPADDQSNSAIPPRIVARQINGGSMKAMAKWL